MSMLDKTRLKARVTPQQKKLVAQAAAVSGMSLADFVKNALLEKANHTLRDHTVIELCLADQEQLAAHVLNPPQAPAQFKELAKWRKRQEQDF
jgi:uncharacterized protein (DUF1778 family)